MRAYVRVILFSVLSFSAAAMTSPLSDSSQYIWTSPNYTNLIEGRIMGPGGDYRVIRAEDIAFLHEAFAERRGVMSGNTNLIGGVDSRVLKRLSYTNVAGMVDLRGVEFGSSYVPKVGESLYEVLNAIKTSGDDLVESSAVVYVMRGVPALSYVTNVCSVVDKNNGIAYYDRHTNWWEYTSREKTDSVIPVMYTYMTSETEWAAAWSNTTSKIDQESEWPTDDYLVNVKYIDQRSIVQGFADEHHPAGSANGSSVSSDVCTMSPDPYVDDYMRIYLKESATHGGRNRISGVDGFAYVQVVYSQKKYKGHMINGETISYEEEVLNEVFTNVWVKVDCSIGKNTDGVYRIVPDMSHAGDTALSALGLSLPTNAPDPGSPQSWVDPSFIPGCSYIKFTSFVEGRAICWIVLRWLMFVVHFDFATQMVR